MASIVTPYSCASEVSVSPTRTTWTTLPVGEACAGGRVGDAETRGDRRAAGVAPGEAGGTLDARAEAAGLGDGRGVAAGLGDADADARDPETPAGPDGTRPIPATYTPPIPATYSPAPASTARTRSPPISREARAAIDGVGLPAGTLSPGPSPAWPAGTLSPAARPVGCLNRGQSAWSAVRQYRDWCAGSTGVCLRVAPQRCERSGNVKWVAGSDAIPMNGQATGW